MMRHLENAAFGVLDYIAYPLGMVIVAPVLIHSLGLPHFGIWAFCMTVVNTGAIVGSGFGDANIRQVAFARGASNMGVVRDCVRTTFTIHLTLGSALAALGYALAPLMARHIVTGATDIALCTACLRLASAMVLVRTLETVAVSTQRAFERYREAVHISAAARLVSLLLAALMGLAGRSVMAVLACMLATLTLGTFLQFVQLRRSLPSHSLLPGWAQGATAPILTFGAFTWAQATLSAVFSQADRLVAGLFFGSAAVGAYVVCMQIAQPIAGIAASAFHFVFPYLARTTDRESTAATQERLTVLFTCNVLLVSVAGLALFAARDVLLRAVGGAAMARNAALLTLAIVGSSALALSTTGTYALLALGQPRSMFVCMCTSGLTMLAAMPWLAHHDGLRGLVISRILFGAMSLSVYLPLVRLSGKRNSPVPSAPPLTVPQEIA